MEIGEVDGRIGGSVQKEIDLRDLDIFAYSLTVRIIKIWCTKKESEFESEKRGNYYNQGLHKRVPKRLELGQKSIVVMNKY